LSVRSLFPKLVRPSGHRQRFIAAIAEDLLKRPTESKLSMTVNVKVVSLAMLLSALSSRRATAPNSRSERKEFYSAIRFHALLSQNTRLLVQGNDSLPQTLLAVFTPVQGTVVPLNRLRSQLNGG
jgi:hypothetical protein